MMWSFFTPVSVDPTMSIIKHKLQWATQVCKRTPMSIYHIITLLEFYLKSTFWPFPVCDSWTGTCCNHGILHQSHCSLPVYERVEIEAIHTSHNTPRLRLRYKEGSFVIQNMKHNQQFLQHINSIDPHIQFTVESPNTEGSIPIVNTLVSPGPDNSLLTTVYGKPTHTDQYLHRKAITTYLPDTVYLIPLHIGSELFMPT